MKKLFDVIKNTGPISIVVHNNPDPDALASASALRFILMNRSFKNIRIYYDGLIGRAENQAVLKILKAPLFLTPGTSLCPMASIPSLSLTTIG
jgi:nanoRNase/pAp phosphatase (c-di-AMP/oligoRNAs hydrolase)